MFRIEGAKNRQHAPGAESTNAARRLGSAAATRKSQGVESGFSSAPVCEGRMAASEPDPQLVAMLSARHQQRPVGRMVRNPDRPVVDAVLS